MKSRTIKLTKKNRKEIPIFFATDDNYVPYMEIAIRSLIENASKNYKYKIIVLNTGIKKENIDLVTRLNNEYAQVVFKDISLQVEPIKHKLRNVFHYGLAAYYRLFIEQLFPEYSKALYLDCDIVVTGDISKLYNVNLGNNYVAAVSEHIIMSNETFSEYARTVVGVEPGKYYNSGILCMNLRKFRQENLESKFIYLINKYNFETIAPDQDYLNALTRDKVKYLPVSWNKVSLPSLLDGDVNIVHYALYKKPWQYDDVIRGEYFWKYAKTGPFYDKIIENRNSFDDVKKAQKEKANIEIVERAERMCKLDKTFNKVMFSVDNDLDKFFESSEVSLEMNNLINEGV